jgi:FtsZ-binding cell division protein ZapB
MVDTTITSRESIDSTLDGYTCSRIVEYITEPEEKIAAVTGHLLMANLGREKYQCHLYLTDNKPISCTFDEDVIDDIDNAMRHQVYAIGISTINPINDEIDEFHIKQIIILDEEHVPPQRLKEDLNNYIRENDTIASFRRSWQEALSGNALPVSELWDSIDAE